MDDLVAWLRGVLDEDERLAVAAADGPGPIWRVDEDGDVMSADPDHDNWVIAVGSAGIGVGGRAGHIARHDPAAVLAGIEAKRAVLDLHLCACPDPGCRDCGECSGAHHADPTPAPCQTVRLLAWAYRDRRGYQPEWAPDKD